MVGHLAKADPACAEGVKKRHHARHDGAAISAAAKFWLDGLVDGLGSARLMLLVNYRPEYRHAWASKTCYSQIRLDPLPAESTTELLESLLGEDASLVPLKQLLVKRGNPFFLEETVYFEKSLTISRSVTE